MSVRGPRRRRRRAWRVGPAGVGEQGVCTGGFSRNLGDPESSPCVIVRQWGPDDEPLARNFASWIDGSETTGATHGIAKRRQRSAARGAQDVGALPRSSSPGQSPSRGPPRSGQGDFHHPAPPWSRRAVTHPQIGTMIRGVGRGKSRSKSRNLSHVHRVRWLRRFSHWYHARRA